MVYPITFQGFPGNFILSWYVVLYMVEVKFNLEAEECW